MGEEKAKEKEEKKTEKEAPKKEEKKKEKKEETKEEPKTADSSATNTTASNTTASVNATATNKTEKAKPVLSKESVNFVIAPHDIKAITKENLEVATKRLHEMEAADQMKLAVERAMNNLESFIFE